MLFSGADVQRICHICTLRGEGGHGALYKVEVSKAKLLKSYLP